MAAGGLAVRRRVQAGLPALGLGPVPGAQMEGPEELDEAGVGEIELVGSLRLGDGNIPELGLVVDLGEAGAYDGEGAVCARALGEPGDDCRGARGGLAEDPEAGAAAI